jgi:hypothetical protein
MAQVEETTAGISLTLVMTNVQMSQSKRILLLKSLPKNQYPNLLLSLHQLQSQLPKPIQFLPQSENPKVSHAFITIPLIIGKFLSLPAKAQIWAKNNKGLAIGGVAGTAVLASLIASAYPLWKYVIQPRLEKMKKDKSVGGRHPHVKRDIDEEYVDELISDPEFLEFLQGMAEELEA